MATSLEEEVVRIALIRVGIRRSGVSRFVRIFHRGRLNSMRRRNGLHFSILRSPRIGSHFCVCRTCGSRSTITFRGAAPRCGAYITGLRSLVAKPHGGHLFGKLVP